MPASEQQLTQLFALITFDSHFKPFPFFGYGHKIMIKVRVYFSQEIQ